MEAASLVVKISAEGAEATKAAIQGVGDAVEKAGQKLMKIGDAMMGVGAKLTAGLTLPLVAIGGKALSTFIDFEDQIAVLDLVADEAAKSFGSLSEAAVKLGEDSKLVGIGASEAAEAMTNFYKAGLTSDEIFGDFEGYMSGATEAAGAFRAAVDLATAGSMSLNDASRTIMETMSQFQLPFTEATDVVNTMVRAADAGLAEVSSLAEGLAVFGPIARSMGYDVQEAVTALGMLEDAGIHGSRAGTMLRSMFTQLTSEMKPVKETLFALGVELYNLEGNLKPMPVIFEELSTAMAGMTDQQRFVALNALADTQAIQGLAIMLQQGQEGWDAYATAMESANDAADVTAAKTDTLKFDLEQLGSVFEGLQIKFMEGSAGDIFRPLVQGVTELATALGQLDPATMDFGVKIAAGLAAIGPGLLILGGLAKAAGLAAVGLAAVTGPVGLLIGGMVALGAAMGPLNGMIEETFNIKLPTLGEAFATITDNVNTLRDAFKELGSAAGEMATDAAEGLSELGSNIIVDIPAPEISDDYESSFVEKYRSLFEEKIGPALSNLNVFRNLADIGAFKENAATMAAADAKAYSDAMTTELGAIDWSPAATGIMAGMESVTVDPAVGAGLAESVNQTIIAGMESVTADPAIAQAMMDNITASLDAAGIDGGAFLSDLLSSEALAGVEIDMSGLSEAVTTALSEALPAGMEGIDLTGVGDAVATQLQGVLSTSLAGADFSSVGASLQAAFSTMDLSGVGTQIVASLTAGISAAASGVSAAGAALAASLASGVTAATGTLSAAGAAAAASFAAGVQSGVGAAAAAGAALASAVTSAVGSINLFSAGASAGSSLAAGLMSQVGAVAAAAAALSSAAKVSTKKELKMESPSKVFMEYGELAAQGFAMGLAGGRGGSPSVTLNINGASFGQQPGGAGLMRAIDDYLRKTGTLSRV